VLKRGALVAAANWPVTLVQAVADALFKLLIAVPLVGGLVLATIVLRTAGDAFATDDWRLLATSVITSLLSHRIVFAAFLLSLAVVLLGGSMLMFLVKGGSVAVLVRGERMAGPVEAPPLRPEVLSTAAAFSIELFIASARQLFPRYARLGAGLMAVYLVSGAAYLAVVAGSGAGDAGWGLATVATAALAAWTTVVNLLYLLTQVVIAAEDCSVSAAVRRVIALLRREAAAVAGVFLVILALVILASGASILAFGALGLISLVPFMWLAAVPLQIAAFVLRAIVFQYIALSSIAAYVSLYREAAQSARDQPQPALAPAWNGAGGAGSTQESRSE
jgi:hypothetical protein